MHLRVTSKWLLIVALIAVVVVIGLVQGSVASLCYQLGFSGLFGKHSVLAVGDASFFGGILIALIAGTAMTFFIAVNWMFLTTL